MSNKPTKKKLCVMCGSKKALYSSNHKVRFRKDHNLCFRCFRSLLESVKSLILLIS